jgi:hypothetical protein
MNIAIDILLGFWHHWMAIVVALGTIWFSPAPRLILQIFVPSRLDPAYAPKSGFELALVDCYNSCLKAHGVE